MVKTLGGGYRNSFLSFLLQFCKKNFLILLFSLINITLKHKKQKKQIIQMFPHLKYTSLEQCQDYKESLIVKCHLSYLLGEALIKAHTTWYKGGYCGLYFKIQKAKQSYILFKNLQKETCIVNDELALFIRDRNFTLHKAQELYSLLHQTKHYKALHTSLEQNIHYLYKHYEDIRNWICSEEFKLQYENTNHPYPPLLNPDTFNDTKEKLNYTTVNADIAWSLNMPLPPKYKFLYISPHGVGAAAFLRYLNQCCKIFCAASWIIDYDAQKKYCFHYTHLSQNKEQVINLSEITTLNFEKYLQMFDKKIPIIYGVRDPISLLKHVFGRDWSKSQRKGVQSTFSLSYDWRKYIQYLTPNPIDLNIEEKHLEGFLSSRTFFSHFLSKKLNFKNVYYLDTNEINTELAFKTINNLATKFQFTPPQTESEQLFKIQEFRGYIRYLSPLYFVANKEDLHCIFSPNNTKNIEKPCIINEKSFVFTFNRVLPEDKERVNILTELTQSDLCNDVGVYIQKDRLNLLLQDEYFYTEIKKYLSEFCKAIKEIIDITEATMLKENDILVYLSNKKELSLKIKALLDKELIHIKQYRPDIVASWKYYQEFEKMCEED